MSMFITQFLCRHRICFDNHHYQWLWYYRIIPNTFFVQVVSKFCPQEHGYTKDKALHGVETTGACAIRGTHKRRFIIEHIPPRRSDSVRFCHFAITKPTAFFCYCALVFCHLRTNPSGTEIFWCYITACCNT